MVKSIDYASFDVFILYAARRGVGQQNRMRTFEFACAARMDFAFARSLSSVSLAGGEYANEHRHGQVRMLVK